MNWMTVLMLVLHFVLLLVNQVVSWIQITFDLTVRRTSKLARVYWFMVKDTVAFIQVLWYSLLYRVEALFDWHKRRPHDDNLPFIFSSWDFTANTLVNFYIENVTMCWVTKSMENGCTRRWREVHCSVNLIGRQVQVDDERIMILYLRSHIFC